ncbi:hypothetical protein GGR58DRAFT_514651 [Xylaria digitata]|nr:hypothetical protein GGR58DRAFT_514651 [Xylaria digitata]
MAEKSLPLGTRLSNIKDFSDLTLVCHGRKYGLHKAIVCSHSAVIANDLRSGPRGATASFLHVPFDTESTKRLIEFMYTGNYQLSPDRALELLSSGMSRDSAVDFATDLPKLDDPSNGKDELWNPYNVHEGLACHARMDSIASYYDIPALSALARTKVDDILEHEWSADAFCGLIQESLDSTSDQEYYQMLAEKAVNHADELVERHVFEKGGVAERLAPHMLPILMGTLKTAEAREQELRSDLSLEKSQRKDEDQKSADRSKALDARVLQLLISQVLWYYKKQRSK